MIAKRLAVLVCLGLAACGGGTAGTSSTGGAVSKVFAGIVSTPDGAAVSGATVRVTETGDSDQTDSLGRFTIGAELQRQTATIEIETGSERTSLPLQNLAAEPSIVSVRIELASTQSAISNTELSITGISGEQCGGIFESAQVINFEGDAPPLVLIEQQRDIASDVVCNAAVHISRNGASAAGVGFQLIFVPEFFDRTQEVLQIGTTDANGNGVASFAPDDTRRSDGYFVIEAPADRPFIERVGVVISPLRNDEVV